MNKQYQNIKKQLAFISSICGSLLIGLPAMAIPAAPEQPVAQTNPNPGIFNEAPYNRRTSNTAASPLNPNPSIFNEAPYNGRSRTTSTEFNGDRTSPMMQRGTSGEMMERGNSDSMMQRGTSGETMQSLPDDQQPMMQRGTSGEMMQRGNSDSMMQRGTSGEMMQSLPDDQQPMMQRGTSGEMMQRGTSGEMMQSLPDDQQQRNTPMMQNNRGSVLTPPTPEELQSPSAVVIPMNGMVNVKLVNATGANISYQVIGDTNQRSLSGKSDVMLKNLPTPVTVTFKRNDGGLLKVTPQASSERGMLQVTFTETTDLGTDKNAMTIRETGDISLN